MSSLINTFFGALAGASVGAYLAWCFLQIDKEKQYLINAKNVLLVLGIQLNRFSQIEEDFNEYQRIFENDNSLPKAYLVGDTVWLPTKEEILSLHSKSSEENMMLVYNLMYLVKDYEYFLDSLNDYNKKLMQKVDEDNPDFSQREIEQQCEYFRNILSIIKKIKFKDEIDKLYEYLKKNYKNEVFPKPCLDNKKSEENHGN